MSIKIDLKIFLFLFLFLITSQVEIYITLMIFAIIHELGHLLMGVILGFKTEEIKLSPVGLQIKFKVNSEEYSIQINKGNSLCIKRAIIALAGPITNLAIAVIVIILGKINMNLQNTYIYQILIYSNFLIAMFNLIPIYPMDGGRVLNEIIRLFCGNKVAYKITYIVSKTVLIVLTAVSSVLILYIHNISIVIILAYLWYLEIMEIRRYNRRKNINKLVKDIEEKNDKKILEKSI